MTLTARTINGVVMNVNIETGDPVGVHQHEWIVMGGQYLYWCNGCSARAKSLAEADRLDHEQEHAREKVVFQ